MRAATRHYSPPLVSAEGRLAEHETRNTGLVGPGAGLQARLAPTTPPALIESFISQGVRGRSRPSHHAAPATDTEGSE